MTNQQRTALNDCISDLKSAQEWLTEFDDEHEVTTPIWWAINDVIDDVRKALK